MVIGCMKQNRLVSLRINRQFIEKNPVAFDMTIADMSPFALKCMIFVFRWKDYFVYKKAHDNIQTLQLLSGTEHFCVIAPEPLRGLH